MDFTHLFVYLLGWIWWISLPLVDIPMVVGFVHYIHISRDYSTAV